jgi:hypothetical protein
MMLLDNGDEIPMEKAFKQDIVPDIIFFGFVFLNNENTRRILGCTYKNQEKAYIKQNWTGFRDITKEMKLNKIERSHFDIIRDIKAVYSSPIHEYKYEKIKNRLIGNTTFQPFFWRSKGRRG